MKWDKLLPAAIRGRGDQNLRLLLKNSSWLAISGIGGSGFRFVQTIIVARILGVEYYGVLALIFVYVGMLNQLIDFRISETVIRYASEFIGKGQKDKLQATLKLCYILDASTGLLAFLLVIATSSLAAKYIVHKPDVGWMINLYALSLICSTINGTSSSILQIYNKFSWLSVQGMFQAAIGLVIIVVAWYIDPTIKGVIMAYVVIEFLGGVSINLLALKVLRREGFQSWGATRIFLLKGRLREMGGFLLTTNLHFFLGLFTRNMDIIFLGYLRNPTEVGLYRISKSLAETMSYIYDPIRGAIYPTLAKIWSEGNRDGFVRLARQTTMFLSSLLFPSALFLLICIPWIIHLMVGINFLPATNAARILLIGIVIAGIFSWLRPAFLSMGRADIPLYVNIGVVCCQIILTLILVRRFGYIGSAITQSFLFLFGHAILLPIFIGLLFKLGAGNQLTGK